MRTNVHATPPRQPLRRGSLHFRTNSGTHDRWWTWGFAVVMLVAVVASFSV